MKLAWTALLLTAPALAQCGDLDFNNDGVYPDDADTIAFSNVLAGADCPTCDSIDFNGDGVFPDERDYTDWLAVLAGGPCSNGGFTPVVCGGCPERIIGDGVPSISIALAGLPRVVSDTGMGTPAIISVPYREQPYEMAANWPGQDGLAYGGLAGRPLIIRGLPGPDGERPTLRLPANVGAGMRVVGSLQNVQLRGLRIVGDGHGAIVAIQGDAGNVLIEDCELVGGVIGININGMGSRTGTVRIRRNIIRDQSSGNGRAQCIYTAGDTYTLIEQNYLSNNNDRSNESQGLYLVYGNNVDRTIVGNWFFDIFGAAAQLRGGNFTYQSNVHYNIGTFVGNGHPMAWQYRIWTSSLVTNNLFAKSNRDSLAQWGAAYGLCAPCIISSNIFEDVTRPWMPFSDQQGETDFGVRINTIPVGDVTRENNIIRTTLTPIDWQEVQRTLLSRKSGEWGPQFETAGIIERSRK